MCPENKIDLVNRELLTIQLDLEECQNLLEGARLPFLLLTDCVQHNGRMVPSYPNHFEHQPF